MIKKTKFGRWSIWTIVTLFILGNLFAITHAYKFTHFSLNRIQKTETPSKLSTKDKIKTLLFGVDNPRPENKTYPRQPHTTIKLKSNKGIECWSINTDNSKGTVIIFHGFSGEKSSMLDKSDEFLELGYNTFLVDFMGSGGSEGNQTTLGFHESKQVKTCFDYITSLGEKNIILFGTSMGSVAIMKAIKDDHIQPSSIILECPFGSMYKTVCARFNNMRIPSIPAASLLVFWGGIENGFWAFSHNPTEYAKSITCPTLLLYGEEDQNVSRYEINQIFENLNGKKTLKTYPKAGHENYLIKYRKDWVTDVREFLE